MDQAQEGGRGGRKSSEHLTQESSLEDAVDVAIVGGNERVHVARRLCAYAHACYLLHTDWLRCNACIKKC